MIADRVESIPTRIARCAAAAPERLAIVDAADRLTYGELERRSDQLAMQLQLAGAGPDRCVGIFLERSPRFIVAALAVMKSGAAYLPLDPSTPTQRAAAILADSNAIALLTASCTAGALEGGPWLVMDLDRDLPGGGIESAVVLRELDPRSLAYVIYTSGSSGEPKGVEIEHAALCNLIDWHISAFGVTPADRASHVAGLGFDAAVWEIWPYLSAGASVHVADELTRRSPEALREWIVAQHITIGFVPTALAERLLRTSWPAQTSLRTLLTGGEALRVRPVAGLPFAVVNNYGPTECTVVATSGPVSADGPVGRPPSIGRPIANALAVILDDELRAVAPGEVGELCIGGPLVARGYRNRSDLTSSRFVTHQVESGDPLRVYRTGDRARVQSDGEIEFLGRYDDQVKIRGYRIELGEIVACLNGITGVQASAVSVRELGDSGPTLVAYLVLAPDARLTAAHVRNDLGPRLPDYMVPAHFVVLPELPTNANGKVDSTALPAPSSANMLANDAVVREPVSGDGLQERISTMVASMLGLPSIPGDENIFMVGGHSMLGVELVARIRDTFGVKLTLRQLFTAPTVTALSAEVARLTAPAAR